MARRKTAKPANGSTVSRPKVASGEPGFALGLAGFICSFVLGIVGIVLSAVALSQSKRIGKGNTFAFAGLIIGIIQTIVSILGLIAIIFGFIALIGFCNSNPSQCTNSSSPGYGTSQYANPPTPSGSGTSKT